MWPVQQEHAMSDRSIISTEDYLDWLENRDTALDPAARAGLMDILLAALGCAAAGLPLLLMRL
jgi:hypothetical protein